MKHMKFYRISVLLTLVLSLLLTACSGGGSTDPVLSEEGSSASDTSAHENHENAAPDFTVLNSDGEKVKLSDFFGKPIVINFWASWCPPCKAELPDFEKACKAYDGKVTFLMVNLTDGQRETVEVAKSFIEAQGYTFPVYFDIDYEASYKYGLSSIPQTYFLDAQGNIVAKATGMLSASQLEKGIGMIYEK